MEVKYEFRNLLIHKETKSIIDLSLHLNNGKSIAVVHETEDGFNQGKQVTDAAYMKALPILTGNVLIDTKAMLKHLKTHGYKLVNTISNTLKGIKYS